MGVALMILLPLVVGWFVHGRLMAFVAYLAAFSILFTAQTTVLIVEWAGGSKKAFGSFPKGGSSEVWSYVAVNLVLLAVGFGLLIGTNVVSGRRRSGRGAPVAARVAA